MVSATTYTLVGVVNKFLTVSLNVFIWDKHSSAQGMFAVCICLLAGTFYQQAPRRDEARKDVPAPSSAVLVADAEASMPLVSKKDGGSAV